MGEGIRYFRRPGHMALLAGVSLFTYGFGGLVYWLARRRRMVCPACGLSWEWAGRSLPPADRTVDVAVPSPGAAAEIGLPSGGIRRRALGVLLIVLATVALMVGIAEMEIAAVMVGVAVAATGSGAFVWGLRAQQERRRALTQALERRVLLLATERGGTLTVTEVAAALDLSLPASERVLMGMDDGFRVCSEVTNEGILLYEFPEVRHRRPLGPGKDEDVRGEPI